MIQKKASSNHLQEECIKRRKKDEEATICSNGTIQRLISNEYRILEASSAVESVQEFRQWKIETLEDILPPAYRRFRENNSASFLDYAEMNNVERIIKRIKCEGNERIEDIMEMEDSRLYHHIPSIDFLMVHRPLASFCNSLNSAGFPRLRSLSYPSCRSELRRTSNRTTTHTTNKASDKTNGATVISENVDGNYINSTNVLKESKKLINELMRYQLPLESYQKYFYILNLYFCGFLTSAQCAMEVKCLLPEKLLSIHRKLVNTIVVGYRYSEVRESEYERRAVENSLPRAQRLSSRLPDIPSISSRILLRLIHSDINEVEDGVAEKILEAVKISLKNKIEDVQKVCTSHVVSNTGFTKMVSSQDKSPIRINASDMLHSYTLTNSLQCQNIPHQLSTDANRNLLFRLKFLSDPTIIRLRMKKRSSSV